MFVRGVRSGFLRSGISCCRTDRITVVSQRSFRGRSSNVKIKPLDKDNSFFKLKNTNSVHDALKIISENGNTHDYYHASLLNQCRAGNLEFVKTIMNDMKENNVEFNVKTYHLLLTAYASRKDYKDAVSLFREMKKKNVTLDDRIYATMIKLQVRGQRPNEVLSLIKDSVASGVVCDWKIFQQALGCLTDAGKMTGADEILEAAKQVKLDGIKHLYDDIILAYARREDIKSIRRLIDEMQETGIYVRPFCLKMLEDYEEQARIDALELEEKDQQETI